ncbi:hypothetical protein TYRP_021149 [Tyrophagus putrescentiae]|nr:hypothetical protein TYRP_021149 [Tyrophagus putrescentiae]
MASSFSKQWAHAILKSSSSSAYPHSATPLPIKSGKEPSDKHHQLLFELHHPAVVLLVVAGVKQITGEVERISVEDEELRTVGL